MQKISGKRIFTGTFWASSSARWLRLTRISLACTRRTPAMGMPKASAWIIAPTNDFSSGTSVRSPSARIACTRPVPICISCRTRKNSWASGPVVRRATCARPASNARPDSTEIVSRSSASGSSRRTCCDRSYATWYSHRLGATQPTVAPEEHEREGHQGAEAEQGRYDEPQQEAHQRGERLEPQDAVGVPARRVAGEVEAPADPQDAVLGGEPAADGREPVGQRVEHPLGERPLQLLLAHVTARRLDGLHGGERPGHAASRSAWLEHAGRDDEQHERREEQQQAEQEQRVHVTPRP